MSIEKNFEKENVSKKDQQFLGKKTESSNSFNNIIDNSKLNINHCKICSSKDDLIKCSKCSSYYCRECLKQIAGIKPNKLKDNEYICPNCQSNVSNLICYICGNQYEEKNLFSYNANQEQKKLLKSELLNKGLSLAESEEDLLKNKNNNTFVIICNNCNIKYKDIIQRYLSKNKEKEEFKKQRDSNIIDELTNIISKEKGETNIFNILDNKSESGEDNNNNINKEEDQEQKDKNKDLFDTFIINKKENEIKEINQPKEQNNKDIQKNIKTEENANTNLTNIESKNKFDLQKMLGNNFFLREINENNNININTNNSNNIIIINKNKNEIINNNHNISPGNINNSSLLNSNILDRNINQFLNINPNNQNPDVININSSNKPPNIYLPQFFTTQTVTPLQNSQNINPMLSNLNNIVSPNIMDVSNINNNLNSFNDINSLINTQNQINNFNNLKSSGSSSNLIQNSENKNNSNLLNPNNLPLEDNKNFIPFIPNLTQNNNIINNIPNNILNYDLSHNSNLNNCATNLGSIGEGVNHLIGLGEQVNLANKQSNLSNKNIKQNNLNNSVNNIGNNFNNSGIENEIKTTLNQISKDLYSFDNNNIENNLSIINHIELLAKLFENIINEQKLNIDGENNNNNDDINILNLQKSINNNLNKMKELNIENKIKENQKNINNNISNNNTSNNYIQSNNISNINTNNNITDKNIPNNNTTNNNIISNNLLNTNITGDNVINDVVSNNIILNNNNNPSNEKNLNEQNLSSNDLKDGQNNNQSYKVLINYILSVNSALRQQLRTMKMYIEVQKVFVAIIFQNIEIFLHNLSLIQNKIPVQNSVLQQKNPSHNKDIHPQNPQNSTNNILSQINSIPHQLSLGTLNNLQTINPVAITTPILNSSNFNYTSPIFPIPQILGNNNIGRGLSLFNIPGQQLKQDFPTNIPNIFNGNPHFPLHPTQQGMNVVGNPMIGQNIQQIMPILNQMSVNGSNTINNNLQFVNNQKNIEKNEQNQK